MTRILHVLTVGLEWATCCLSNMLKFNLGKIVSTEHATKKKCKESQCSREQWANGKTSAPPSYVQQELFFSLSQNTCDLFILFHMGQFLGKSCVRGDGLCSTRKCCWGQWAEVSDVPWSQILAAAKGAARPSLVAPCSPSTACVCTACTWALQCFSFSKLLAVLSPPKLPALILKVLIRGGRHLHWYCQNGWVRYCPVMQHWLLSQFYYFYFFFLSASKF